MQRAVQTVKNLWRKNSDRYRALLDYRTMPIPGIKLSPAQLLMGRRLRNRLPMMDSLLQPASVNQKDVPKYLKKMKEDQKKHHDRHASSYSRERKNECSPGPTPEGGSQDSSQTSPHTKVLCSSSRWWQKLSPQQAASASLPSPRT